MLLMLPQRPVTPLVWAVRMTDEEAIRILLGKGAKKDGNSIAVGLHSTVY